MRRMAIACVLAGCASASVGSPASGAVVTTLSGSGAPGVVDGPAASARFLMPTALAYAPDGTLIVVDTAAQRIRSVSPAGVVSTIAGGGTLSADGVEVEPDYRDGPAHSARFNWPRGVAVSKDGTIYVADTGNHCVRSIKNGTVRTVVGDPRRPRAPLGRPIGVAVNAAGDLYVADPEVGLMRFDHAGGVTTIAGFHAPYAVGLFESAAGEFVFGADVDGIYERLPYTPTDYRYTSVNQPGFVGAATPPDPKRTLVERVTNFDYPVGYPGALLIDGYDMFFGDVRTNSIRYIWSGWAPMMRVLAGPPIEDASNSTAGYVDGTGVKARFNAPTGLAARDHNTLAIADTGNRRIRILRYDVDSEVEATRGQQLDIEAGSKRGDEDYGIAMVGNSYIAYDATWTDSILGMVQRQLRAAGVLTGKQVRVAVRMGGGVNGLETLDALAKTIAGTVSYRMVLFNCNIVNFGGLDVVREKRFSMAEAVQHLRNARSVLAQAGIPLIAVIHPVAEELSPGDVLPTRMQPGGMEPFRQGRSTMVEALDAAGIETIDAYPEFVAHELVPGQPVFGATNGHFAREGRSLMAAAIVRALERLKPWDRTK